jgi:integrase
MSIHKRADRGGKWQVKYRVGGRLRSRTFDRKQDAVVFDSDLKRRRSLGPMLAAELERENMTLLGYVRGAWAAHAATLAQPTREKYAWALEKHLRELVDEPLLALDVTRLAEHQQLMLKKGRSPGIIRAAFAQLSGILQVAAEGGYIAGNPARALRKVPAEPGEEVKVLAPVELEGLIAGFTGRDRAVVLLAGHLGLRPIEIRMARWGSLQGNLFTVERGRTKRTAARTRVIEVPDVTAHELKEWRLQAGRPGDDEPIIGEMSPNAMKMWSRRNLPVSLYALRHSHASALHYAGFTVPEAAERLGHGPALHVETYAHVIRAMSGQRYGSLDELIAAARVPQGVPRAGGVFPKSSPTAGEGP